MTADTLIDGLTTPAESDVPAVAALIKQRFPGAVVWFGNRTRHWWAMVAVAGRPHLFEGTDPEEVTGAIVSGLRSASRPPYVPVSRPCLPADSWRGRF
jgi:hypothetical protein